MMFAYTLKQMKTASVLLLVFTVITGMIYPIIVTVLAQFLFHWQANGSLIQRDGQIIGSALIAQSFTRPEYFWGRPSLNSMGSNLAAGNPDLLSAVKERIKTLHNSDMNNQTLIPVDLVTASGSGLDPDISPQSALYQVHRIARERKVSDNEMISLINQLAMHSACNILGEPRVNVLTLNLALDRLHHKDT